VCVWWHVAAACGGVCGGGGGGGGGVWGAASPAFVLNEVWQALRNVHEGGCRLCCMQVVVAPRQVRGVRRPFAACACQVCRERGRQSATRSRFSDVSREKVARQGEPAAHLSSPLS